MANGSELALILEGGKAAHEIHSANLQKQAERIGLIESLAIAAPAVISAVASAGVVVIDRASFAVGVASTQDLAAILAWFIGAILLSLAVPVFNRLRHASHTMGLAQQQLDYRAPYVHDNRRSRLLLQISHAFRGAAMAAVAASYAALTVGGMAFLDLVR